jgi:hypothetical protein
VVVGHRLQVVQVKGRMGGITDCTTKSPAMVWVIFLSNSADKDGIGQGGRPYLIESIRRDNSLCGTENAQNGAPWIWR